MCGELSNDMSACLVISEVGTSHAFLKHRATQVTVVMVHLTKVFLQRILKAMGWRQLLNPITEIRDELLSFLDFWAVADPEGFPFKLPFHIPSVSPEGVQPSSNTQHFKTQRDWGVTG